MSVFLKLTCRFNTIKIPARFFVVVGTDNLILQLSGRVDIFCLININIIQNVKSHSILKGKKFRSFTPSDFETWYKAAVIQSSGKYRVQKYIYIYAKSDLRLIIYSNGKWKSIKLQEENKGKTLFIWLGKAFLDTMPKTWYMKGKKWKIWLLH